MSSVYGHNHVAADVMVLPISGGSVVEGDIHHSLCVRIEYEGALERPVQVSLIPNSGQVN